MARFARAVAAGAANGLDCGSESFHDHIDSAAVTKATQALSDAATQLPDRQDGSWG